MAITSLPSFNLTLFINNKKQPLFGSSSYAKFGSFNKNRDAAGIHITFCKAAVTSSSPLFFRDLDADDFRHPLDKQVS